jgi:alginate O-acetyltransferase complex protein AlgI
VQRYRGQRYRGTELQMEFSSLAFMFVFLPVFLLLFFALKREARNSFLLMASLVFYIWGEGQFVLVLLLSITVNYFLGLALDKIEAHGARKFIFILAMLFNLGVLIYFKYTGFILDNLGVPGEAGSIHLPIGISFFTFQALSFLIDIYRKTVLMDKDPVNFALYLALFPKLTMGPITPYHNLNGQIQNRRRSICLEDFAEGVKRFIIGLGKKTVLANSLAVPAREIFALAASDQTAGLAWLGIGCYTLQIYFDFSGYTDMAVGIGRMCGFTFLENFNYPYVARSIKEFWRRWHISLAKWLRDYLFLPMAYAVSRKIKKPRLLGIKAENWAYFIGAFFTFLLCGLWHGANWTFVLWGGYYGLLLVGEHAGLGKWIKRRPRPLQLVYCQLLVVIGWVFFRSPDLHYAFSYLKAMAGFGLGDGVRYYPALYLNPEVFFSLIIVILGTFPLFPKLKQWYETQRSRQEKTGGKIRRRLLTSGHMILYNLYLTVVLLASIMVMAAGTYNPFIYFRF